MAIEAPYKRLGDSDNYLTPEARRALLESHEHLTEEALVPTPTEIFRAAVKLARMVEEAKHPQAMKDAYSRVLVLSRGGSLSADAFTHTFGYKGREVLHASVSSYTNDGTQEASQIEVGQLPPQALVEGQRILAFDEVCDSGRSLQVSELIFQKGLGMDGLKRVSDSTFEGLDRESSGQLMDELVWGLDAANYETAVIDYKPTQTKTDFIPTFWLHETDRWIIYPHEVLEQLGNKALSTSLWAPNGEWV